MHVTDDKTLFHHGCLDERFNDDSHYKQYDLPLDVFTQNLATRVNMRIGYLPAIDYRLRLRYVVEAPGTDAVEKHDAVKNQQEQLDTDATERIRVVLLAKTQLVFLEDRVEKNKEVGSSQQED